MISSVVHPLRTYTLVEEAEVPAFVLVGDALSLGIGGGGCDPEPGGSLFCELRGGCGATGGSAYAGGRESADVGRLTAAAVEVDAEAVGDVDVALSFEALADGAGRDEVDRLAVGCGVDVVVGRGGVTVLEADVVVVRVEGHALEFEHSTGLVGGRLLRLGRNGDDATGYVEDAGGGNDASKGSLAVDGPVGLEAIAGAERGQPGVIVGRVGDWR